MPLLEIVSEPDMRTGIEAAEYGAELQRLVRYLGISNGNMQEGSLRCDVNVSVRPIGQPEFGTKVIVCCFVIFSSGLPRPCLGGIYWVGVVVVVDLIMLAMTLFCWQVEIKNLNSFSSISRAIDYEILRQAELHSQGKKDLIVQETRLWEEGAQVIPN